MAPITTGRRKLQTIVKRHVFEKMRAVEARRPFRGRASANHDGTLNCSAWLSMSLSDTVGVCDHPPPQAPREFFGAAGREFEGGK